jgi:hypothetical protein
MEIASFFNVVSTLIRQEKPRQGGAHDGRALVLALMKHTIPSGEVDISPYQCKSACVCVIVCVYVCASAGRGPASDERRHGAISREATQGACLSALQWRGSTEQRHGSRGEAGDGTKWGRPIPGFLIYGHVAGEGGPRFGKVV